MPRKYVPKRTNRYNNELLQEAVLAVQSQGLSIREASSRYNIPKSTIGDTLSKKYKSPGKPGRSPIIPIEIEDRVARAVIEAARQGIGISKQQLLRRVGFLCKKLKINFKNNMPGKEWFEGFKRRHPEVSIRKPEKLATTRARMVNQEILTKYFGDLGALLDVLGLKDKPHLVWNADETGKSFEHQPVKVLAEKGSRNVVGRTTANRTNITIMACVNAAGTKMSPLMIVKGKTSKSLHGFNTAAAPNGTRWFYQSKGWMTDEIGENWFRDIFLRECGPERPQLLIMDGHSSHETLAIIELAMEENIAILCLPPHTTHVLQPLDRSVFGPFNAAYNLKCSEYLNQNVLNNVNKWSFPGLFKLAWEMAVSTGNIVSGFQACGIFPWNPSVIPSDLIAPSIPTDTPQPNESQLPPPELSEPEPTPEQSSVSTAPTIVKSTTPTQQSSMLTASTNVESNQLLVSQQSVVPMARDLSVSSAPPVPPTPLLLAPNAVDVSSIIHGKFEPMSETSADFVDPPTVEDPEILLQLLQRGDLEIFIPNEEGVVTLPSLDNSGKTQVSVPRAKSKQSNCKSHRLLTSIDILQEKRKLAERKVETERKKQERLAKRKK